MIEDVFPDHTILGCPFSSTTFDEFSGSFCQSPNHFLNSSVYTSLTKFLASISEYPKSIYDLYSKLGFPFGAMSKSLPLLLFTA